MENTLLRGDRILAQVFPLQPPTRGQMILFISPADRGLIFTKRVIAVPGDHLRIAGKNFPNDVELPGCSKGHEMVAQHVADGEIVVPAGDYFVLGDNRENSLDSRCWGFVRASDVLGRPLIIYDSIEWPEHLEFDPSKEWMGHRRWARLFKVL